MKPSLQVRLSQHLALTPQLQQSIRLLQLSTLELQQEIGQMLEQNPFLELEEDHELTPYDLPQEREAIDRQADRDADFDADFAADSRPSDSAEPLNGSDTYDAEGFESGSANDSGTDRIGTAAASNSDSPDSPELRAEEFGTTERTDWENGTEADDFDGVRELPSANAPGPGSGSGDNDEAQDRNAAATSLQEHLREQSAGMRMSAEDRAAFEVLLESLNEDGYLIEPLEDLAQGLIALLNIEDEEAQEDLLQRLRCALHWLQNLEPVGVGARSLGECLTLQLRQKPKGPATTAALMICDGHLELLARRDMKRLSELTGTDEVVVRSAHELIRSCEPKPGRAFAPGEGTPVVPDVIVRKSGRNMIVTLNPDVMPKLRINDLFANAVRGQRGAPSAPALSSSLQEARWFVKNIQQRFDTILRVSKAIVERQKAFFTHGDIAMKPLVLREIADELGLHESTISRVTTAKYMATTLGTYELKYFFGSSLNTEAGGNASSTAVRALIQQFVTAEDIQKPLSDSQLSHMLEEQGIQVARRTVAKYRDALKIAPANQRKAL